MKVLHNLIYFVTGITGFILAWIFTEIKWILPLTTIVLILMLIIKYLHDQQQLRNRNWIGFGKKSIFYKELIYYLIFGGIMILLGLLPPSNNADVLFGLDITFYMGCFFMVTGFINSRTYPVVIKDKTISFIRVDSSSIVIRFNDIVSCSNQKEILEIATKKKKIEIVKADIPLEMSQFEIISDMLIKKCQAK